MFEIGKNVKFNVVEYDDQGNKYTKIIEGKVVQVNDKFVTIDNGKYKESYLLSSIENNIKSVLEEEPYDLSIDSYENDIVKDCVNNVKNNKDGYVFNSKQLNEAINLINDNSNIVVVEEDGIYYIKNKQKY